MSMWSSTNAKGSTGKPPRLSPHAQKVVARLRRNGSPVYDDDVACGTPATVWLGTRALASFAIPFFATVTGVRRLGWKIDVPFGPIVDGVRAVDPVMWLCVRIESGVEVEGIEIPFNRMHESPAAGSKPWGPGAFEAWFGEIPKGECPAGLRRPAALSLGFRLDYEGMRAVVS